MCLLNIMQQPNLLVLGAVYQMEMQDQINLQALIKESKIKVVKVGNLEIFHQNQ